MMKVGLVRVGSDQWHGGQYTRAWECHSTQEYERIYDKIRKDLETKATDIEVISLAARNFLGPQGAEILAMHNNFTLIPPP